VNAPPEFMMGKLLIARGTCLRPERIRDTSLSVKDLAA
jgi:hypothetical protein